MESKVTYRILSPEEREQDRLERQEWARQDQAVRIKWAIKQSKLEVAKTMLEDGKPVEKIIRYTSLTNNEVEGLRHIG